MLPWLHENDTLISLSDEAGAIGDWAALQCLFRALPARLPNAGDGVAVAAAWLPPTLSTWGAQQLQKNLAPFRTLAHRSGVIPEDTALWTAALTQCEAAAAGDLLVLLGTLTPDHLPLLLRNAPAAPTIPAWLIHLDPESVDMVVAEYAQQTDTLLHSLDLLLPTPLTSHTDAIQAAEEAAGRPCAGKGSARRRLGQFLAPLAKKIPGPAGRLAEAILTLKGVAIPPQLAYAIAGHGTSEISPQRAPHHLRHRRLAAPDRGLTTQNIWEESALCSLHPERIVPLLEAHSTRAHALYLARYTPIEPVLEALLQLPLPADPIDAKNLALALIYQGIPLARPTIRAILPHLHAQDAHAVSALAASIFGQPL